MSNIVVRQRPLTYLGVYLLLIPIFSAIYTFTIPNDFVHSNLYQEPGYDIEIQKSLEELLDQLKTRYRDFFVSHDGYAFSNISNLHLDDFNFTFDMMFFDTGEGRHEFAPGSTYAQHYKCVLARTITLDPNRDGAISLNEIGNARKFYETICLGEDQKTKPIDEFVSSESDALKLSGESYTRALSLRYAIYEDVSLNEDIFSHVDLTQGSVRPGADLFFRMTYFSIITITTLGFGDIAPITSRARAIVGLESLSGLILLGLFFNAVASKPVSK